MEPTANGVHPLPLPDRAFHPIQPIHSNPVVLFQTAELAPRRILNLENFDAGNVTSPIHNVTLSTATGKLAPLTLIAPSARESLQIAAFQTDLNPIPSNRSVSFTANLEPHKTFGVRTVDHPPVADLLAQVQVNPSAAIALPATDDSFQPFAPTMEAPMFAGDTEPIAPSTEFGKGLDTDSAAGLWPLIGNDNPAVPKVEDSVAFGESAEFLHFHSKMFLTKGDDNPAVPKVEDSVAFGTTSVW